MKTFWNFLLTFFCVFVTEGAQTLTNINVGVTANDRTGDSLRTAFIKVNTNFSFVMQNSTNTSLRAAQDATNSLIVTNDIRVLKLTNAANTFGGSGALLTSLNASNLSSGTVPMAQLSTSVTTNNGALTVSRLTLGDGGRGLTVAAASGAVPIDADGSAATAAQVTALFPSDLLTNNYGSAVTLSNTLSVENGSIKIDFGGIRQFNVDSLGNIHVISSGSLSLSNLTASRIVMSGADEKFASAAASGAVPVDADGSATTVAQLTTLAGGTLTTNNATLTSGRVMLGDGARGLTVAAASGAVPVDADGSATTFSQINAIAPSAILTNNWSGAQVVLSNALQVNDGSFAIFFGGVRNFNIDTAGNAKLISSGSLSLSNLTASRIVLSSAADALSSAAASGAVPVDADGSAATFAQVNALAPGAVVTQGFSSAMTFSNNVAVDAAHSLSVSNLTASRMVLTSAADALSSVAASGAVPIDADGSAATFAQVNALAPGAVVTQGFSSAMTFSNALAVDAAHSLSVSNLTASRIVLTSAADALSSAAASGAVPVDADGSATTSSQINALFPSRVLTNNDTGQLTGGGPWVREILSGSVQGSTVTTTTSYGPLIGIRSALNTGATNECVLLPSTGYLSNFNVCINIPSLTGTNITFAIQTNTISTAFPLMVDSLFVLTMLPAQSLCTNDLTHSILLSANLAGAVRTVSTATTAANNEMWTVEWWHQ